MGGRRGRGGGTCSKVLGGGRPWVGVCRKSSKWGRWRFPAISSSETLTTTSDGRQMDTFLAAVVLVQSCCVRSVRGQYRGLCGFCNSYTASFMIMKHEDDHITASPTCC